RDRSGPRRDARPGARPPSVVGPVARRLHPGGGDRLSEPERNAPGLGPGSARARSPGGRDRGRPASQLGSGRPYRLARAAQVAGRSGRPPRAGGRRSCLGGPGRRRCARGGARADAAIPSRARAVAFLGGGLAPAAGPVHRLVPSGAQASGPRVGVGNGLPGSPRVALPTACRTVGRCTASPRTAMPTAAPKVLLVGDFPPPYGGVAVHVEVVREAVRRHGGGCTVLDIGKGQLPADGVVPAGSYARFVSTLFAYALRGYRIHVHTSGANPKSWALAATCAAVARFGGMDPLITFHSGLGPEWLAKDPFRARVAGTVASAFAKVIAVSE